MSGAVMWVCCAMLLSLSLTTCLPTPEEEMPPAVAQDALGLLASLQPVGEGSNNDLRKMANMYELLQLAALQQQQQQRQRFTELERDRDEGEEMPQALPLQDKLATLQDEYITKRGSYMSLCHFKICNMGKRNRYLRRN